MEKATISPRCLGSRATPSSPHFLCVALCSVCLCFVFFFTFWMCFLHVLGRAAVTTALFLLPHELPDPHSLSQVKEAGRVVFLVSKLHRLTARLPPPASRTLPPVCPTVHLSVQHHVFWPIDFGGKPRSSSPLLFGYWCDKKGGAVGVGTCTVAKTTPMCLPNQWPGCEKLGGRGLADPTTLILLADRGE